MTTETAPELEVAEPTSDETNGSAGPDEPAPVVLEEPETEKIPRFGDPRQAVVDIVRDRLDHVLQPVSDDEVWHGVNVVTRKDLNEVLALDLPPASIFSASVRTPAFIYVDAICPVCGIAGEITLEVGVKLVAEAHSRKLQLAAKAGPRPHQCGQQRLTDIAPTTPIAEGQTALDLNGIDSDDGTPEPDDEDAAAEADALHNLAMAGEATSATDDDLLPF